MVDRKVGGFIGRTVGGLGVVSGAALERGDVHRGGLDRHLSDSGACGAGRGLVSGLHVGIGGDAAAGGDAGVGAATGNLCEIRVEGPRARVAVGAAAHRGELLERVAHFAVHAPREERLALLLELVLDGAHEVGDQPGLDAVGPSVGGFHFPGLPGAAAGDHGGFSPTSGGEKTCQPTVHE